ncbi:MAG: class II glutamine amidotransferase [Jatrophihabitantaceae bacterium]
MCRLFGLHAGSVAIPATFWLLDAPDSLAAQSHRNPDGAGIGSFDAAGNPTVDKQPLAAFADQEFVTGAHDLLGTTFVAHVRYASTGAHTTANTHPFLQADRLFAHNGVVQGLDLLDARLASYRQAPAVLGQTDSERVFALITAEIARHDGDVLAAITAATGWIAENLPLYALNFVLASADQLWVLRYPATHELYLLERPAGGTGTDRQLDAASPRIRARSSELAGSPAVVVASEPMDDDPGWRLLESGQLLLIDRDLSISSWQPLPAAPRHLLRLDQLDPKAASSQHPSG